jgi:hypothetical protein
MNTDRNQLYKERKSLGEFLRGNALNMEFHRLYSIYLKNNKDATLQKMNELAILNEVYYQCTFIHNSEEPIDKAYVEKWQKDLTKAVGSKDAADFVACLVMGVFEAMSRHSLTERNFKKWMKMLLVKSPYYNKVNTQVCEFRKLFGNVDVDLNPQGSLKLIPIPYEELKETEEYKQTVSEMKSQLGKKYIRLDTIADCILRLPTVELQYAALQQVNTLLSGTAWSEKAAEVLETMFAKVKEQQDRQEQKQDKMIEEVEKAANKKANEFNVYPQAGSTANLGCQMQSPEFKVIPPSTEQQPALESNKEGDEDV